MVYRKTVFVIQDACMTLIYTLSYTPNSANGKYPMPRVIGRTEEKERKFWYCDITKDVLNVNNRFINGPVFEGSGYLT